MKKSKQNTKNRKVSPKSSTQIKKKTTTKKPVNKTTKSLRQDKRQLSKLKDKKRKNKLITVPTNSAEKLVEHKMIRKTNFLSATSSTHTTMYNLRHAGGNKYEVSPHAKAYSAILKLVMTISQTNDMSLAWSKILWDITQSNILDRDIKITSVRSFQAKDETQARKDINGRKRITIFGSNKESKVKDRTKALSHDASLLNSLDEGNVVLNFGAELIVTAPTEIKLEKAVNDVSNYLKVNDETRGMQWRLDVNKQLYPFIAYGPNKLSGHKGLFYEMTADEAAVSALYVDSGGDRNPGSEYVGYSVGKLIKSHAAYNFINSKSLFVGNDTLGKTYTRNGVFDESSEIYLSKVVSRAYLLQGKRVLHFVVNTSKNATDLTKMPIKDKRMCAVDVAKGLLNIIEAIKPSTFSDNDERTVNFFSTHLNNIIILLSQFRDISDVNVTDEFAQITKKILISFFIKERYWQTNAMSNLSDLRLFANHDSIKTISDFSQYVSQAKLSAESLEERKVIQELEHIIKNNILIEISALNVRTDPIIDDLVSKQYKVVDLSNMAIGASGTQNNPSLNIMGLAYLNVLLPSLENGDVIMFHGLSKMQQIAPTIFDAIATSGSNIDIVFTESNNVNAERLINILTQYRNRTKNVADDLIDGKTATEDELKFVMIDLYKNRVSKLTDYFNLNQIWAKELANDKGAFYVETDTSLDYIYLDSIL